MTQILLLSLKTTKIFHKYEKYQHIQYGLDVISENDQIQTQVHKSSYIKLDRLHKNAE